MFVRQPRFTSKREHGILILALVHLDVLPVWELWCAGFRHSAGFHATLLPDGATGRLRELGDVRDVLSVLGVDLVVPIMLRVLVP